MVGGKLDFEKKIPPMGEGLGGKLSPPWAGGWGGSFRSFPPTMGGKWDWGGPPQAENFANLRHPSDDFPLENSISEGKISRKCQNFPPAAG